MHKTRDYRRHQRSRAIARVNQWLKDTFYYCESKDDLAEYLAMAKKRHAHPQVCSTCCGNQRKYYGATLQEIRHFESWCDDLS
jgi:hypothetical protein